MKTAAWISAITLAATALAGCGRLGEILEGSLSNEDLGDDYNMRAYTVAVGNISWPNANPSSTPSGVPSSSPTDSASAPAPNTFGLEVNFRDGDDPNGKYDWSPEFEKKVAHPENFSLERVDEKGNTEKVIPIPDVKSFAEYALVIKRLDVVLSLGDLEELEAGHYRLTIRQTQLGKEKINTQAFIFAWPQPQAEPAREEGLEQCDGVVVYDDGG